MTSEADCMLWCCPSCKGILIVGDDHLTCTNCHNSYPVVAEIPDLRCDAPAWVDFETDRVLALELDAVIDEQGLRVALEHVFCTSRGLSAEKSAYRARQVLDGAEKCTAQMDDWLGPVLCDPVLEIGTGAGQFLAAATERGRVIHGIDVSLEWLVVAKHWVRLLGGTPRLAAALAERLPLADGAVGSVVALDVLEHVGDQHALCREMGRVLSRGGRFGLVTPNRYSLAPEPHVGVWGVGYLPVRWQAAWVALFSPHSYAFTRLFGVGEVRSLIQETMGVTPQIVFPPIASEEIVHFGTAKARLAHLYNTIVRIPMFQSLMRYVGPYYRIIGETPNINTSSKTRPIDE